MQKAEDPAGLLSATLSAAGFLSRLPVFKLIAALKLDNAGPDFGKMSRYFAPAGLIVALPAGLLAILLSHTVMTPFLIATLAIAALTATTGALHEDGLGDVADGLGGGATRERKLEIMRDSRIGTYGAVTLVLSLLIRIGAVTALLDVDSGLPFFLAFLGIAAASRGAMVWLWAYLPPARAESGLSRSHGMPSREDARFAVALAAMIGLFGLLPLLGPARSIFVLVCGAFATVAWAGISKRQIGGHTGDVLGATQQICEVALLLACAIAI